MLKLKTILFPTDFSKPSEYAFEVAVALARDHGASLVILHVHDPDVVYGALMASLPPAAEDYNETIWQAFHNLEETDPRIRELKVETRIEEGDAAFGILEAAKEVDATMIVMGTHGRTGPGRLLMGSVAEEVLRKATCPVMTVKSPMRAASKAAEPITAECAEA